MTSTLLCLELHKTHPKPRLWQATLASTLPNKSSHTVPQIPLRATSRRPWYDDVLPASLTVSTDNNGQVSIKNETRKCGNCDALQLEADRRRDSRSPL